MIRTNSFFASGDFCRLLITYANSLDPDQDRQNGSKPFDTLIVFLNDLFQKVNFEKKTADDNKSMKNYPTCLDLTLLSI